MERTGKVLIRSCLPLLLGLPLGCAAPAAGRVSQAVPVPQGARPAGAVLPGQSVAIWQAAYRSEKSPESQEAPSGETPARQESTPPLPAPAPQAAARPHPQGPPFAGVGELSVEALVEQVLARNPSLPQMVAAWQAASARYPQVTSLDDPLFGTALAPAALDSREAPSYRFEIFQRYPWPGKLGLRGASALAEASAAGRDVENVRQQLIESARDAFYDYYLSYRSLEINEEALRLLREFRKNAETRYKTGLVPQQDVLQADVEIGRQRNRGIQLERQRQVALARVNALLHLPPDLPLPPPPKALEVEGELPDPQALRAQAQAQRLDLLQLADRIMAAEASLKLAYKEYYPDIDLMAIYDAFWDNKDQRPSLAVRVNLPVRLERRRGAVAEAEARLAELHAQYARQTDQAGFEVQQAYEQWRESLRTVRLFDKEVLPAARENVKAAQATYVTGRIPFLTLVEAQRGVVDLQDEYYRATTDFFRRRTALQRALTGTPATSPLPMPAERPMPGKPGSPVGMGRM